jgi:hypothetical protein
MNVILLSCSSESHSWVTSLRGTTHIWATCLRPGTTWSLWWGGSVKHNICELFVVKGPISIGIIDSEEIRKVTFIHYDSNFSDCFLESWIVNFSRILEIEEFKWFYEESFFILISCAFLGQFIAQLLFKSIKN